MKLVDKFSTYITSPAEDFSGYIFKILQINSNICGHSIVLYCIDGVVIAVQYTANFLRSIVLPEFRY